MFGKAACVAIRTMHLLGSFYKRGTCKSVSIKGIIIAEEDYFSQSRAGVWRAIFTFNWKPLEYRIPCCWILLWLPCTKWTLAFCVFQAFWNLSRELTPEVRKPTLQGQILLLHWFHHSQGERITYHVRICYRKNKEIRRSPWLCAEETGGALGEWQSITRWGAQLGSRTDITL